MITRRSLEVQDHERPVKLRERETYLALEFFNAPDLDPISKCPERVTDFQALSVIRCYDADVLIRCR